MSECCNSSNINEQNDKRHICPLCQDQGHMVSINTILHHAKKPWKLALADQPYYFCDNPLCDVVYFGKDDSTIKKDQLRTAVGIKETIEEALICYCYGVTKAEAESNKQIKQFIILQTRKGLCTCATSNPSGKCCLKEF